MAGENVGIQIFGPVASDVVDDDPGRYAVQVRESWDDEWEALPHIQPQKGWIRAAPKVSEAEFLWEYGNILETDAAAFAVREPQDLFGWFVRVVVLWSGGQLPVWTGRFGDSHLEVHGATTYPQGDQTIKAYGLEHELDRYRLKLARAWQNGATIEQRTLPAFNERSRRGAGVFGNRSTARHEDDVYEFSADGATWSALDIAESLLAWNLPDTAAPFQLGGQASELAKLQQVYRFPAGATLKQALDTLIDPRRGLGWCVRIDDANAVFIHVYSVLDEAVSLSSYTLPANAERFEIRLDDAQDIDEAVVTERKATAYKRIVVQGAPSKSVFTLSFADATLEEGFSAGLLTAFKAGCTGDPNYAALGDDNASKASWNEKLRATDRFERIGHFRIPQDWDGFVGDGEGGPMSYIALPSIGDDGEVDYDTPQALFLLGRAFLQHLPGILVGRNYSAWPPGDENPGDGDPEFRKPFVLIKHEGRWAYIDKLAESPSITLAKMPSGNVRMVDRELAVHVEMKPRFVLLRDHWTGAEPGTVGDNVVTADQGAARLLAYEDMLATVAMEGDHPVRIVAGGEEEDDGQELLVEVPDAELVYLVGGTVVDVDDNGNLLRAPGPVFVIDDRDRLRGIAALTFAWYRKRRATVRIRHRTRFPLCSVGQLMIGARSASDAREVNTVVTEVDLDFEAGACAYKTMYADVSFAGFAPEFPTNRSVGRELLDLRKRVQELNRRTGGLPSRIGAGLAVAAATLIGISGYAEADASSPDAFKTSSSEIDFQSESITNGVYSDSKRIVFKLQRSVSLAAQQSWFLVISNIIDALCLYNLNTPQSSLRANLELRLSAITEDFDLETQTSWNALAALSSESFGSFLGITGGNNGGGASSVDDATVEWNHWPLHLWGRVSAAKTIYGFILDVRPTEDGSSPSPDISDVECYVTVRSTWDGVVGVMYLGGTPYRSFLALSQQ